MPPLPEALRRFAARVWDDSRTETDPGFAVYQRNLHGNFAAVLALEFPAVQRLLGETAFGGLARDFQRAHPSLRGDLHGIGAPFAAWLRARPELPALTWIADVAMLEWAWEEAAVAADADRRVDLTAFAALDPETQMVQRARLHPALRVVRSAVPVHTIWRDNLPDSGGRVAALQADYSLSLDTGGESVIVERPGLQVEVSVLPDAEAAWLQLLAAGATLGDAIDAALAVDSRFDLGGALVRAVQRTRIIELEHI